MRWNWLCVVAVGFTWVVAVPGARGEIETFASADLVLGDPGFTNPFPEPTSATSLNGPTDIAIDPVSGKVFVSDLRNHRVLRYGDRAGLRNGAAAEAVIGQPDFTSGDFNAGTNFPTRKNLNGPKGLSVDPSGNLWVADGNNGRVLLFRDAANLGNYPDADLVLGRPDFVTLSGAAGTSADEFTPLDVWADGVGNLWIADQTDNRVLKFTAALSKANGAAADRVFGQTSFTTRLPGVTASKLHNPTSVQVDSRGILWVADSVNNRVVGYFNAAIRSDGAFADVVVGQSSFTEKAMGVSAQRLREPTGAHADDDGRLWVTDSTQNRVLRFDTVALPPALATASVVIGQADFVSGSGGITPPPSARRLDLEFSSQSFVDENGDLWVADGQNSRVLRFPFDPVVEPAPGGGQIDVRNPTLNVRGRKTVETLRKRVVIRGTAADASGIARIEVKVRGAKVVKSKVKGNDSFKVVLRVRKDRGRVVAKLRAVDGVGLKSKRERFRILRR